MKKPSKSKMRHSSSCVWNWIFTRETLSYKITAPKQAVSWLQPRVPPAAAAHRGSGGWSDPAAPMGGAPQSCTRRWGSRAAPAGAAPELHLQVLLRWRHPSEAKKVSSTTFTSFTSTHFADESQWRKPEHQHQMTPRVHDSSSSFFIRICDLFSFAHF